MGRCPNCGEWNSLVESISESGQSKPTIDSRKVEQELVKLSDVKSQSYKRVPTGYTEFDRVLGGGIVPGSIVLIAGDPGIGKSTLLLQTAIAVANGTMGKRDKENKVDKVILEGVKRPIGSAKNKDSIASLQNDNGSVVLYVTGEESAHQVKLRADRITKEYENLYILPVSSTEAIIEAVEKVKPTFLIVDSIQTLTTDRLDGPAGSVGQVRECAQILQRLAKSTHTPIFIVGHVTKEGSVAGPKTLEHLVDAVLSLEGDGMHTFRLLRSVKNRFGSTFEVGVFEMSEDGMREVANPSQIFLEQRLSSRPGSVVCSTIAGGRPLIVEIQALTTTTSFGIPARKVIGLDFGRVQVVIAALTRSMNMSLGNMDVYVNVAGGLKIDEPAADLAVALAIASATMNKPVPDNLCAFGEVGLLGELRPVGNAKNRMAEAKRLGFTDFVTPERFRTLEEAVRYAMK
jgi:DNA repair protein RadA/Sms